MNFPRVRPAGWAFNNPMSSAEANQLDIDHTHAPNFDLGSAHTPAADIELTGPHSIKLMGSQKFLYASRSVERVFSFKGALLSANFTAGGSDVITQGIAGSGWEIDMEEMPMDGILQAVSIRVDGAPGHTAVNITATPPKLSIYKVDVEGATTLLGATKTDTSVTLTYEAPHWLTVNGIAHTIDRRIYRYLLVIDGEVGGDWQAGCAFTAFKTYCDITKQSEY